MAEDADKGTRTVMLIRHGATDLNDKDVSVDRVRGWKDVPLSAGGKKEAERLGEKLMDDPPDVILTSDLKRAAETADIISMITGVPIGEKVKMFRPWDVGKWAGVKTEDALPVLADYAENKPNEPIDGGEPFTKFRDRFLAGMMAALNKYDGTIAIVTHHRNERLLRAWENAGFPSNGDIDIKTFNKEGEHTGAVIEVDVPVARLKAELEQEGGGRDASVIPFDGSVDPIFIAPATKPDLSKEKLDKIVAAASEEPPTAQELEKAKKSVALQVQYVPGHEYMPAETMQKMVDAFNKTYAGKELTSEQDLTKKVTDFKLLKAAVAEMGAKTKAEQEKVQAENAAKQQAVAAKQQAAAAEQLKKQAEVEKKKAAELHAENKEFMDSLGISEAEAEGVKGLLPSVLHLRHVDLMAEMESAERAAKERGPAATAKRLEEEAAALEAEASPEPDVKDLDEEPT